MDFILVIDESGAKGYSDKEEKNDGEIGLMAGYLLRKESINEARKRVDDLFDSIPSNGKRHLTDLKKEQQEEARDICYGIFKYNRIPWFYNAIYSQGFYEANNNENRGSIKERELLHSKIFLGVFLKAISYVCHSFEIDEINLTIISDNLDKGVIKIFKKEVGDHIKIMTGKSLEKELTSFNKIENKIYSAKMETKVIGGVVFPMLKSINFDIQCENSSVTFMADILANSALYHINKIIEKNSNFDVNSKQAISSHPLHEFVVGCHNMNDKEVIPIFDIIYRREKIHTNN